LEIGWMWFDDDEKRTFEEKVRLAVQHYRDKFGHAPNVCFVNEKLLTEDEQQCGRVRVVAARNVMPGYFWLGVEKEQKEAA
jgi:hypothetical protein